MKKKKENNSVLKQFNEMKQKHPDAILLFRAGQSYATYREDALKTKQILGLELMTQYIGGVKFDTSGFKQNELDSYLPRLVRAGMRVVICDPLKYTIQDKSEKSTKKNISNSTNMPRKKKELAPEQEQPKAEKTEAKGQKTDAQLERKPREPQMITVNGDKVSHGHSFPGKDNPGELVFHRKNQR